ncbi:MAG: T9SS type A sorting domain-containing protein [Bacteroidetes bacterium]|nr:MAG: T9SS type A sorting domain-containing protein [Bacteroidota bacterium]
MNKLIIISVFFSIMLNSNEIVSAAVCNAVVSGNWSNPATWSCGSQPGCGDLIIIPAGITLSIDVHVNLDENSTPACSTATIIQVYGTMDFSTGKKMYLACGSSVEIFPGGSMNPGSGGGSSNLLYICQTEEWKAGDGPVTGYTRFGPPVVLSLEFKGMSAKRDQRALEVQWLTGSEANNTGFRLEFSNDGVIWNHSLIIESIGDHTEEYEYAVEFDQSNEFFYSKYVKLTSIDENNHEEFLAISKIDQPLIFFTCFPNPVLNGKKLHVHGDGLEDKLDYQLILYNSSGKIHTVENVSGLELSSGKEIEINGESGMYFLEIKGGSQVIREKIIIQ